MDAIDAQTRRVNPSAFEDRHSLLDPEDGSGRVDLRQEKPGPTAITRARGEQFGKGGAGRRARAPALAQPRLEGRVFTPSGDGDSSAGDERQAFRHTTHNASVLLLFLSLDSETGVNPATRNPRFLQGIERFRALLRACPSSKRQSPCGSS